jgi:hypothetical protein
MKPRDDEPEALSQDAPKPSRSDQARRIVEEYANDLREIIGKLRKQLRIR